MLTFRQIVPVLFLALGVSAMADDTQVTLTGAHLCCGKCEKAATAAVTGVGAKVEIKEKVLTVSAADAAAAQKAVDALVDAGFWVSSNKDGVAAKDNSGVKAGRVESLALTGVHNCCAKCEKAILAAVKGVEGVTDASVDGHDISVKGKFDAAKVIAALHAAGLHAKAKS